MRSGLGFLFGFVVLLIGAMIAIDVVIDIPIPVLRSVVALVLLAWGTHLVANAWRRTRPSESPEPDATWHSSSRKTHA